MGVGSVGGRGRRAAAVAALFCAAACGAAAGAERVVLVRGGKAVSTIVLAENPTKPAQLAAFDLQHHLRLMSGADVPIVRGAAPATGSRVFIGESDGTRAPGVSTKGLRRQEQIVRTVGKDLFLLGRDKQVFGEYRYGVDWFPYDGQEIFDTDELGSFFAVCTFLEHLGVRWYWPGELGEVVPRRENVEVAPLNLRTVPFMDACRFNGYNPYPLSRLWVNPFRPETMGTGPAAQPGDLPLDRLRFVSSVWRLRNKSARGIIASGHSELMRSYLKRDPGAHAYRWGTNKAVFGSQLCLSSPRVVDEVAVDIVDAMTGREDRVAPTLDPFHRRQWLRELEARQVSLGPEDTATWCTCPGCAPLYDPMDAKVWTCGTFSTGTHSRYYWRFVAAVAAKVKAAAPDAKLVCLAYWSYFHPPKGLSLPDNVIVVPCCHWPYHNDPKWVEYERRTIAAWGRIAPGRVVVYAYYLFPRYSTMLAYPSPRLAAIPTWNLSFSAPRMLAAEMKHAARNGVRGFTAEISSWPTGSGAHDNVIWDHLNMYVTMKLSERPDLDVDVLLNEYYRLFYGPAEAPMKAFWEGLEELYVSPRRTDDTWTAGRVVALGRNLADARTLAPDGTSAVRRRIETVAEAVFNILDDSRRVRGGPTANDFEDGSLLGFNDIFGKMPPGKDLADIVTEEIEGRTNRYLKAPGYFNVMRMVPAPITVGGGLSTIEVKVRMRCRDGGPCAVYLTTLSQPEGGSGGWASKPEDAGFGVTGYQYANHANVVEYRSGGKNTSKTENKALLPDPKRWYEVCLVYERKAKTLVVRVDGAKEPFLTAGNVDLEGAQFKGVWLRGHGSAYDDLSVVWR